MKSLLLAGAAAVMALGLGAYIYRENSSSGYSRSSAQGEVYWINSQWPKSAQEDWYTRSQGSQLVPLDWWNKITDAKTRKPFSSRENLVRFQYPFYDNEAKLPIGFILDKAKDGREWVGFNCAACHTGRYTYEGQDIRIHGAQNPGDFFEFMQSLLDSVTLYKSEIDTRLAENPNDGELKTLQSDLDAWLTHRVQMDRVREGVEHWGPGRLDAIAYIFRKTAKVLEIEPPAQVMPANAPVNPPHLWNTNQQEVLEYNGLVPNGPDLGVFTTTKLGSYFRNYGQAFGVFAYAHYDEQEGIETSINVDNLLRFERALATLPSPTWPEAVLGEIDPAKHAEGEKIYDENCAACHARVDARDLETEWPVWRPNLQAGEPYIVLRNILDKSVINALALKDGNINPKLIGTDPMMACNLLMNEAPAGKLAGQRRSNSIKSLSKYISDYRDTEPTVELLAGIEFRDFKKKWSEGEIQAAYVKGELREISRIVNSWLGDGDEGAETYSANDPGKRELSRLDLALLNCASYAQALHANPSVNMPYPAYKARPLNGIWATPPYLHNGSVPSIRDLLSDESERPTEFTFTSVEYDPVNLGVAYEMGKREGGFFFRVYDENGDIVLGNWNGGHPFGTDLSDPQKDALIEFIKSL